MRTPEIGAVIAGKYRIDETVGEGGFGVVLRATTLSTGRPVALKLLKAGRDANAVTRARRFLREMRAIAQLQSPHTLTLYDFGRTDDGLLYMVCEYVDGEDLLQLVQRRGRLDEAEVVWVLYQVLQSLNEAHSAGILHRDIKPANVRIFTYENDPLRVKVLDFGLAQSLDRVEDRLTRTGKVIGTPRYMSPEQLRGMELTPASDIFSLGVVAVEMMAGRQATELHAGVRRDLELPSDANITDDLRRVVRRMTAPDRRDRYATAAEVLHDLRPLRQGRRSAPTRAPIAHGSGPQSAAVERAPTRRPRPNRKSNSPPIEGRPNPRRFYLGAGALIVSVAAVAWMLIRPPATEPPRTAAERPAPPWVAQSTDAATMDLWTPDVGFAATPTSGCGAPGVAPGQMFLHEGDPLWWNVHIPTGYTGSHRLPLVLLIADPFNSRHDFLRETGFSTVADEHGFIVAAPVLREPGLVNEWHRLVNRDGVEAVVEALRVQACVDMRQVYVYGDGQGAPKTRWLACKPWVTAVVTHHERSLTPDCEDRQVPHLHFTSRDSAYNPPTGPRKCMQFITSPVREVDEHDEAWRKRNGCDEARVETRPHENVTCFEYQGCDEPTVTCRTAGGVGWPGSQVRWLHEGLCSDEPEPAPFPAAEHAWEFFSRTAGPQGSRGCGTTVSDRGLTNLSVGRNPLMDEEQFVYIPRDYDATRPHPLVLLLHRGAQPPVDMLRLTKFAELAEKHRFVIVLPEDRDGGVYPWREPRSNIRILRDAHTGVSDVLCIDPKRVFAVGHGSAGFAVRHLACEPWIRAVAFNSFREETHGLPCPGQVSPSIHLSPLNSKRMLVEGGKDCFVALEPLSLEGHETIWRESSGCAKTGANSRYTDGTCVAYDDCAAPFVSCRLRGGFGWPGSGVLPPDHMGQCRDELSDFPAERVIWDFFEDLSL